MTWEQRYRLSQFMRTSLVLWATLSLGAALVCAPAMRWVDRETNWVIFGYSTEGARVILSTLAGSMLTFIVFLLSATLIVVQLASAQLTPRVIALVLTMPGIKIALSALTFTFTYTLGALGRVEDRVPDFHVSVAVLLNLVCIIVFFRFVQQLSSGLRPACLFLVVAERAQRVIEQVYPVMFDSKQPEKAINEALPAIPAQVVNYTDRPGVIMAFSVANLLQLARDADVVVEMIPQVGDSIFRGDPLFRIFGDGRPSFFESLRRCVAVGNERTLEQDPRFAFRILVDVANKALSPAINDPTTAVLALDQIDHLLLCLGQRRLDEGVARDSDGKIRVAYRTPDWPDFVTMAVTEIRHYGVGSLQVTRRLKAMLEHLLAALPESRRAPLMQEMRLISNAVERMFPDADHQGIGGSES
jgi:uncharacterized membrane protein